MHELKAIKASAVIDLNDIDILINIFKFRYINIDTNFKI